MDVNRQAWTAAANLLVHPGRPLRGPEERPPVRAAGRAARVEAIVTDLDGKAVAGRAVALPRGAPGVGRSEDGEWKESARGRPGLRAAVSAAEAGACRVRDQGGRGVPRHRQRDRRPRAGRNESQLRLWVAGGTRCRRSREVEQEKVTLVPDKKEYARGRDRGGPGAGAVRAGRGRAVPAPIRASCAPSASRMSGPSHTAAGADRGGAARPTSTCRWTSWAPRRAPRRGRGRPASCRSARPSPRATLNLSIPPQQRTLALTVAPRDKALEPGGQTVLDVALRDAAGRPVAGGEVAVVVVDEAVLALTGYRLPDPAGASSTRSGRARCAPTATCGPAWSSAGRRT